MSRELNHGERTYSAPVRIWREARLSRLERSRSRIPSLTTHLLVSQDTPTIEPLIRKTEFIWEHQVASGLDEILVLPALGIKLALAEVFEGVKFSETALRKIKH